TGQTIRGYEIGNRVGSGGYGEVYLATQLSVDRDVAVKVILPQYASDPKFVADFETEAKLVAQLENKYIVPLIDYWQGDNGVFLVMRYVRGGSLKDMLEKQGALSLSHTLRLLEQVAEALAVAHEAGVVHRDLKPANILIDQRGNAYLTDFGIAKQIADNTDQVTSDTVRGTLAYMSPEQIFGQTVSQQTDIYALGVMLYEMLAGRHPFEGLPTTEMLYKHVNEALPDIQDVRDDLPLSINEVIQKATIKAPTDRYDSVPDMVTDLKATVSGVHVLALPAAITAKKKPTTAAERNRHAMLQNVRKFWIEGVLENSLHETVMIDLGMTDEAGKVDNPWDTLLRTPRGDETVTNEHIIDVFDRLNGKVLVLGDPGSGKTITLLTLARDLLLRAESDDHHPMPVVFNLSSWAERQLPLTEWLVEELNTKYQVPRRVGTKWVEDDDLLLLLDGLDEVALDSRDACVNAINLYRSEHGFVDVVVCSRIADYEALHGQLRLNGAIVIQPLTDVQITTYLDTLHGDTQPLRDLIKRDEQLQELAASPLMLSIMVLAYGGSHTGNIPDYDDVEKQREHLFSVYVRRAFERRTSKPLYTQQETLYYLHVLARTMRREGRSAFYIEDLQPHLLNEPLQRRYIIIVSVAFFSLATLLMGFTFGVNIPIISLNIARSGQAINLPVTILVLFASMTTVLYGSIHGVSNYRGARTLEINPIERVEWSFAEMLYNALQSIKVGLALGILYGVIMGGFFGTVFGQRMGIAMLISVSISSVVVYLVTGGFVTSAVETKVRPNQGIRWSFNHAIIFGIITPISYGSVLGIAHALAFDATFGISFGLALLIPLLLVSSLNGEPANPGSAVVGKHIVLRYLLERQGLVPRNIAAFLDHASSLIFLRKVGGGYIFIHRYLLEYFAGLEPDSKENA
ncbi:MAG: protein kinase, partial [Chloroflexota bacterium]